MDETDYLINIVLLIICLSNVKFKINGLFRTNISVKWGNISDNGGVFMITITSDMIISKKTSQLLLTIPI